MDSKDVVSYLKWIFKKIDKGDSDEEVVRMILLKRSDIEGVKINKK